MENLERIEDQYTESHATQEKGGKSLKPGLSSCYGLCGLQYLHRLNQEPEDKHV